MKKLNDNDLKNLLQKSGLKIPPATLRNAIMADVLAERSRKPKAVKPLAPSRWINLTVCFTLAIFFVLSVIKVNDQTIFELPVFEFDFLDQLQLSPLAMVSFVAFALYIWIYIFAQKYLLRNR